jgi:flagellar basal-body rod protein FlgF
MIRGLYSVASALTAAEANHEIVAENLANANVPGYRRSGIVFQTADDGESQGATQRARGVRATGQYTSFEAGPLQRTGNSLDMALSSNVYFVVDGPDGPLYTRNGAFQRTATGDLQNASGLRVRAAGGSINIPANAAEITISQEGTIKADNVEVGRLQLAEFPDGAGLRRAGTTLFEGPAPQPPRPGTFKVEQGYREGSNVQVVNEMVNMISGMRYYEAAEKAPKALEDAVSLNTKPQ